MFALGCKLKVHVVELLRVFVALRLVSTKYRVGDD